MVAEIRRLVPGARLDADGPPLTIAPGLEEQGLDALLPGRQRTPLSQGLAATLAHYGQPLSGTPCKVFQSGIRL